ncbi:MAG TPA: ferritin-like domain-containing protein [Myxococcota bacterium]|jgi:hypothetical protein|nr:ferritin-like domain-containing protein [Myxococcota bacterium]
MSDTLTYDPIYQTVRSDDFPAMLDVDRFGARSDAFDEIISATHDHFWDPNDRRYLEFEQPFDLANETVMPRSFVVELNCAVADRLDEKQQRELANASSRWMISSLLHGEQGALSLSASLCHVLRDPGAQEYAANQTREEARHVTAFARYVQSRFGTPYPCGRTLSTLLHELVSSEEVYKKLIGMQMLVEGLAMGAFATLHSKTNDPLLRRMVQLVMTDEAFHHKFGKIWADRTVPKLTEEEHEKAELWAAKCFQTLLFNLVNSEQKQVIYEPFGLDWQWVRSAVLEAFSDADRRRAMTEGTNIFRVLIKTLLKAGIITERTRPIYAAWVDMDELSRESDEVAGQAIADAGVEELRALNQGRRPIGRAQKRQA